MSAEPGSDNNSQSDAAARVLITGASAGIGAALAKEFARHGHDLLLVARRAEVLETRAQELRDEFSVQVDCFASDLSVPDAPAKLHQEVAAAGYVVSVLVNNAGVIFTGGFKQMSAHEVRNMTQLNIAALTELVHCFLPDMLAAGKGRILNVGSLAGFQPFPSMAMYAASKAYVLTFSEALAEELRGSGVSVTALCPGMTDTDMAVDIKALNPNVGEVPSFMLARTEDVARGGFDACMRGDTVHVPGIGNRISALWSQSQPRWLVRTLGGLVGRQLIKG